MDVKERGFTSHTGNNKRSPATTATLSCHLSTAHPEETSCCHTWLIWRHTVCEVWTATKSVWRDHRAILNPSLAVWNCCMFSFIRPQTSKPLLPLEPRAHCTAAPDGFTLAGTSLLWSLVIQHHAIQDEESPWRAIRFLRHIPVFHNTAWLPMTNWPKWYDQKKNNTSHRSTAADRKARGSVSHCDKCNNANSNYTATPSLKHLLHGNSSRCENKKMFELRLCKSSQVSQDPNFCFQKIEEQCDHYRKKWFSYNQFKFL